MKTEDIVKYALLGVGIYLVWQYVLAPMLAGPSTVSAAVAAANPTSTQLIPASAFPTTATATPTTATPILTMAPVNGGGSSINLSNALVQ